MNCLKNFATAVILASIYFGLTSVRADESSGSEKSFQELTRFFENEVDTGKIPGAVILIQQHGQPIYLKAFGVRDVETGAAMKTDSLFAIKSMTKPITSVAAMMLVDEGRLSIADPLHRYIPDFADTKVGIETVDENGKPLLKFEPPRRPVTIEDLLRQTSGITYGYIGGNLIKKAYTDADIFRGDFDNKILSERIAQLPLSRHPGTLWRYGHSTDVLGRVIEVVTGESIYQFQKRRILDPLGMTSTKYFIDEQDERERMAKPRPEDTVLVLSEKERRSYKNWESAGGGLVSSVIDYAKFAQMILNGGEFNGQRYLSEDSFKMMTTDQIGPGSGVGRDYFYFPGDGFGFGYGFAVRVEPGIANPPAPGSIGELKWDSGSGTYFGVDPKFDMVYILLMQTQTERGRILPRFKELVYKGLQRH